MGGERKHGDKITCGREKQGTVVTSLKIVQLLRADDPLIINKHCRIVWCAGCVAQGKAGSCFGILSVTPNPNTYLASTPIDALRLRRTSDIREVRILALHLVNLTLVLAPASSFCSAAASPVLCSAFLVCLKCLAFPAFSSTCENPVEIILNGPWTDQGPARLRCPQLLCSNLLAICRVMFSSLFPSSGSLPDEKWPKTVIN